MSMLAEESSKTTSLSSKFFMACKNRLHHSPFYTCYDSPDVVYGIYNHRLYPWSLGDDPIEKYWHLRRHAVLYDVPETPIEIEGPDAEKLLNLVMTRNVSKLRVGRAAYGLACQPDGGILMDGMLMKLADQKFWYVQADGEFNSWLMAHSSDLDVTIKDPESWVLQIQGPTSLNLLNDACDNHSPDPFKYFDVAECSIAGQDVIISRTGWTAELGFELYTKGADTDAVAIWEHLLAVGAKHNLIESGVESMGIRRIEAGIMDYGADLDSTLTPYQAGLGPFVDLSKEHFIGQAALKNASRDPLIFGIMSDSNDMTSRSRVQIDGQDVGVITSAAWSPYLKKSIGYWRASQPGDWSQASLQVLTNKGAHINAHSTQFPFYDAKKEIPRGLKVEQV